MQPLPVLLLSDGRPGHYHLAEGVIAAVARMRPVAATSLVIRRRRWLPGRALAELCARGVSPRTLLAFGYGLDAAALPRASLVVSAGGETLVANAAVARVMGAANVFCGSLRRLPPEAFSLIISSYARHATLPHHIVTLKPSGIDPDTLGRAHTGTRLGPQSPPQVAGLLLGGNSGLFTYETSDWEQLAQFLRKCHLAAGTRWIVSTSRRSPDALGDMMVAIAAEPGGPIAELIDFRTAGPGTLPRVFAQAEAILCTEDSSTMISEAVCAQLPVVGVSPARHGFTHDEREYRDFIRSRGWCRCLPLAELTPERFLAELASIEPLRENHLDKLAGMLRERLPQLFA
jgi:mitochondrial fission protein ELM1